MNKYLIILDIETTGFSPIKNEITEIAAIKVDRQTLQIVSEFEILINIIGNVPIFIQNLTGINKSLLNKKGILLENALLKLSNFCNGAPILAHYSLFDEKFIKHNLKRHNILHQTSKWYDTINIFKSKWPNRTTYKLSSLIIDHNLATKEDHRALSDARHTLSLLKMCDIDLIKILN